MKNEQLNTKVLEFQSGGRDEDFNEIYDAVITPLKGKFETIGKSIRTDRSEIESLYTWVLLRCLRKYDGTSDFINFFQSSVARARTDLYRKTKRTAMREVYEMETVGYEGEDFEDSNFRLASDFNLEEYVTETKEADQLALIDSLLVDADARTTAIVEAFLAHPKPSPTAIGKQLGICHKVVSRKIKTLAGNFDHKQFGDYTDYLMAL